jgi:hypothetical protein
MPFDPSRQALVRTSLALGVLAVLFGGLPAPASAGELSDMVERALRDKDKRKDAAPATREEVARNWDAFLTAIVKRAGADAPPGLLRDQLLSVLIGERHRLVAMLTDATLEGPELVDSLFESSWDQLVPILDHIAAALPPEAAGRYRSFLEAGDLMRAAERLGVARDLAASPESLRKLAQILIGDDSDPLHFDTGVDPELRSIFGFGAPLDPPAKSPLLQPVEQNSGARSPSPAVRLATGFADWLFPTAFASKPPADRSSLVTRLNAWIPGQKTELSRYVPLVHDLLRLTADEATARSQDLDPGAARVFHDLVVATAWQESCWRQFVRREGEVQPLVGLGGAIGLMQINAKVWRGIYDWDGLEADIGYNGRAGTEILSHYLRDHALRAGEQTKPGGADNLARAAYAAYNGGPRHLTRYRKPGTSAHLQVIDREFWRKYQAVKAGDQRQMLSCYPTQS